jgi:two-component sensor histidine kinase
VLQWTERNGPTVVKPLRRGFGMTLVERAFGHDVEGEASIDFRPDGVVATMRVPLPGEHPAGGNA